MLERNVKGSKHADFCIVFFFRNKQLLLGVGAQDLMMSSKKL